MSKSFKQHLLAVATLSAMAAMAAGGSVSAAGSLDAPASSGAQHSKGVERFIVQYRDGSTERNNATAAIRGINKALTVTGVSSARNVLNARHLRKTATGRDVIVLPKALDAVQAKSVMAQIAADPNVVSVYPDVREQIDALPVSPQFIPNDPDFAARQWNFKPADGTKTPTGQVENWGGANVTAAWDIADGAGIVVAVLDTGITVHPDLDTSLGDAGYDFIFDGATSGRTDGNGNFVDGRVAGGWDLGDWTTEAPWNSECSPTNSSWHGSHVAGTIAQKTNNGVGQAGVAYGAKVLPVRVLGHCGGWSSDIDDAIIWASGGTVAGVPANQYPAHVINMSLGGTGSCAAGSPRAEAINQAIARGTVVVVSAGNHNGDASTRSPASCEGVITVGANGVTGKRAYYSGYGSTVEISAPGGGVFIGDAASGTQANPEGFVFQAVNSSTKAPTNSYGTGGKAGTSMSSPHVAGVVALMQSARLDAGKSLLTPVEVTTLLQQTVTSFPSTPDRPIGPGIVNAHAAVLAAIAHGTPDPEQPGDPEGIPLVNKTVVSGVSGGEKLYRFDASAGSVLTVMTYGGSGDVSLYVKKGAVPTAASNDGFSTRAGNSETVRITAPTAGTYYIKLSGSYSGLSVVARQ